MKAAQITRSVLDWERNEAPREPERATWTQERWLPKRKEQKTPMMTKVIRHRQHHRQHHQQEQEWEPSYVLRDPMVDYLQEHYSMSIDLPKWKWAQPLFPPSSPLPLAPLVPQQGPLLLDLLLLRFGLVALLASAQLHLLWPLLSTRPRPGLYQPAAPHFAS